MEDQHTVAVAMGTKADPLSWTSPAVHNDLSGQMGERLTPELRSNSRKMHPCKLPLDLVSNWKIWAVGVLAWMQKDLPRKVPIC